MGKLQLRQVCEGTVLGGKFVMGTATVASLMFSLPEEMFERNKLIFFRKVTSMPHFLLKDHIWC